MSSIEPDSRDVVLQVPERELPFDEILRRSFHIYKSRFLNFFLLFLVAGLVQDGVGAVLEVGGLVGIIWQRPVDPFTFFSSVVVVLFVSWIMSTIANGIAVKYLYELLDKHEAGLRESFDFTLSKLVSLLGAGIASFFLIMVGTVFLVIPGVIFVIMFSLMVPAIIIEGAGALESLGRSRRLVSRRWGRTSAVLLVVVIILAIVSWIGTVVASPLGMFSRVVATTADAFIQPVLPIASVLLYCGMRIKEHSREKEITEKPTFFCPNCGQPVSSQDSFCRSCGARLTNESR